MNHMSESTTPMTLTTDTDINNQSDSYSATYFDALYNDSTDPWQYQTRWYEKRKRDMCLAVLPQAKYGNGIELGCGNGVFSELLAHRCQALVCIDGNHHAVQLASQRLSASSHVRVIQGTIPNALFTLKEAFLGSEPSSDHPLVSQPPFDLVVISEILYYLSPNEIDAVTTWIGQNLAIGGTLLCCHWRYPIDGFVMTGDTVHQRLHQAFNLAKRGINNKSAQQVAFSHQSEIIDTDFLLDVWQNTSNSVAMQENLI